MKLSELRLKPGNSKGKKKKINLAVLKLKKKKNCVGEDKSKNHHE